MRIFATRMFCRIWLLSQANVLKHVDTSCIKFTISQHARWMTKWFGQGFDTGLCGCCYSQRFVDAVALDIFSMFIHVFSGFQRSQLPALPGGTSPCSWCSLVQSPVSRQTVNPGIGQIFGVFILEDLSLAGKKNHKVQLSRDGRERETKTHLFTRNWCICPGKRCQCRRVSRWIQPTWVHQGRWATFDMWVGFFSQILKAVACWYKLHWFDSLTFVSCFDTARTCSCAVIHFTVGVGFWQADNQSRSQQETRRRSHMLPTDVELDACTHTNRIAGCYRTVLLKAPGQTVPKRYNTLFMHVVETNVHYRAHYIRVGGLSFDNCTVV